MTSTESLIAPPVVEHPTASERAARGKAARQRVPRRSHAEWAPAANRRDPVAMLEQQGETRLQDLLSIRYGRMSASAFAFFRGAANVFAADLAETSSVPLNVQVCGDAHLVNFGGFASPERSLVFDINDFDETLPGPFEWDVKRLAASLAVAARSRNFAPSGCTAIVAAAVRSYREAMRSFATMRNLDLWYVKLEVSEMFERWGAELGAAQITRFQRTVDKAENKDRLKAKAKLTEEVDGELRFLSDPPLLVPIEDLFSESEREALAESLRSALRTYRRSLTGDRRHLLEGYRFVQVARKVVGVGSVGTRCWMLLLVGRDNDDPLFIQVKEAEASVLEPYLKSSTYSNHGRRVVEGQRLMQASSDILLGWDRIEGIDGLIHDYYMRQLWDWKTSADVDAMTEPALRVYGQLCGWTLARGHARSGDPIAIGAYLGSGTVFDDAIAEFAGLYADQNDIDHRMLVDAIDSGRVVAETGI